MVLLMSYDAHMNDYIRVLSGMSIPSDTTSETLDAVIGRLVEANKVLFCKE